MAIVRPFQAIRPHKEYAEQVISLPYDVMNRAEASEMAKNNPVSFLHICRSEIDIPAEKDPYSPKVYQKAKSNIAEFLEKGIFKQEERPLFYIYKQTMNEQSQVGIVACTSIDDYQNNIIKKHEFTRLEKELDRINHFDVCNANTEPVFLTYRKNEAISSIVSDWIANHEPEYNFTTGDGVGHILWVLEDVSKCSELSLLFSGVDALYIADGHHRSASAAKVGFKRRQEFPDFKGEEEFNFFMAVIFPDEDLRIFDYNRVVKDLNGHTTFAFLGMVKEKFTIEKMGSEPYKPTHKHAFGMYLEDTWYELSAKDEIILKDDAIQSLDVSILQDNLLDPILGIKDPRTDKRIDFIGGIRGLKELERRVHTDMKIAFSLYPVAIADLLAVSDQGLVMPPKSTWFEPKLGSGLFIHQL